MAELENTAPDIDSMSDAQIDDIKGKMMAGEDVSVPADEPVVAAAVADAGLGDDDGDVAAEADASQRQETVPHGRFHREMERRKEADARASSLEEQNRTLMARLDDVLKMVAPKPEQAAVATPPDLKSDPLGSLEYQAEQLRQLQEQVSTRSKQEEEQQAENRLMGHAREQFDTAATADPTVRDAYTALFESFAAEGKAFGLTGQALSDHLTRTEKQHVFYALQNKIPLAEYTRNLAAARGWRPAAANANPAPAASAAIDPVAAQAQIDARTTIKNAAASLTPTGGSVARTGMPSPQELLDMTPKQFDEWRAKNELGAAFAA